MKSILILALLITLATAFQLQVPNEKQHTRQPMMVRDDEEYSWLWDIPRIIFDFALVLVVSPVFFIPSFFLNNQEIYIACLTKFMSLKYIRLSGWAHA